jgi:hypothetical protein
MAAYLVRVELYGAKHGDKAYDLLQVEMENAPSLSLM